VKKLVLVSWRLDDFPTTFLDARNDEVRGEM
jgi:hypothetical protein